MFLNKARDPSFEVLALVYFDIGNDDKRLLVLDELLGHSGQMRPGV